MVALSLHVVVLLKVTFFVVDMVSNAEGVEALLWHFEYYYS